MEKETTMSLTLISEISANLINQNCVATRL